MSEVHTDGTLAATLRDGAQALGIDLQRDFLKDLQAAVSWRTHLSGADLYCQLPVLHRDQLPLLPPQPARVTATVNATAP